MRRIFNLFLILVYSFIAFFLKDAYAQKNGLIKTYYYGSKVQSEIFYINDVIDGIAKYYYLNGRLKKIEEYNQGKLDGWVREFYENGARKAEYYVKEGTLDGYARYYYENNELKAIKLYNRGVLVESSEFLYDSSVVFEPPPIEDSSKNIVASSSQKKDKKEQTKHKSRQTQLPPKPEYTENEEFYYFVVDVQPQLIGGVKNLIDRIVVPDSLIDQDFREELSFKLFINEKGELKDIEIVRGGPDYLNKLAIEQLKKSSYEPGVLKGQKVKSQMIISIPFNLKAKKEE